MAQWYTFPDILLLVDIMLLNFPFPLDPAKPAELAECRPRFASESAAADLPALELLCAIGILLGNVFFVEHQATLGWKAPAHDPRVIREEDPAGYGAGSADRNSLAKRITDGKRRVRII